MITYGQPVAVEPRRALQIQEEQGDGDGHHTRQPKQQALRRQGQGFLPGQRPACHISEQPHKEKHLSMWSSGQNCTEGQRSVIDARLQVVFSMLSGTFAPRVLVL